MIRKPEEFQRHAIDHNITRWPHHDCAICGVWTAFIFADGEVFYDSACACSDFDSYPHPRTWLDIAQHYNIQTNPNVIAQMDAFWHFTPAPEPTL